MSDLESDTPDNENAADISDKLAAFPPEIREQMQQQIRDYQKAYAEEFAQSVAENSKQATEKSLDLFRDEATNAANIVIWMAKHASADGVKLNAAKYILDCLRRGYVDSPTDPVSEILAGLVRGENVNDRTT